MLSETKAAISALENSLAAKVAQRMHAAVTMLESRAGPRLRTIELDWSDLGTKLKGLEASHLEAQKKMHELQEAVLLARGEAPPTQLASPAWTRTPDPTILFISSAVLFSGEQAVALLDEIAGEAGIARDFYTVKFAAGERRRRFAVVFGGERRAAARRAQALLSSLRKPDGWKDMEIKAGDGSRHRAFLDVDKNAKQARLEALARKLRRIIADSHAGERPVVIKAEHCISMQFKRIVRVEQEEEGQRPKLVWNSNALRQVAVSRESVERAFSVATQPGVEEWGS